MQITVLIFAIVNSINILWNKFKKWFFSDLIGRRKSPPPQRPSSPAAIIRIQSSNQQQTNASRPSSALHVKVGSDWLAGGRDLFWENIQKRPRSGHVPGWKEGLPESMKRPRSAVANRTLRLASRCMGNLDREPFTLCENCLYVLEKRSVPFIPISIYLFKEKPLQVMEKYSLKSIQRIKFEVC